MTSTLISVLMPVHGDAAYLKRAIESVLGQTFTSFEFIIILDRPSKKAEDMILKYSSEDVRISVKYSEFPGISNALNVGIQFATTEFVARIDADDEMHPDRLQKQLKEISKSKNVVCIGTQLQVINELNEFLYATSYPTRFFPIKRALRIRNVIAHPSVIARRNSILKAGMYQQKFDGAEDYDLWLRLSKIGKIRNIDERLTYYRINEFQETTGTISTLLVASFINLFYFLQWTSENNYPSGNSSC